MNTTKPSTVSTLRPPQIDYKSPQMGKDIKRGFLQRIPKRGSFLACISLLALDALAIRGYALQLHNNDIFALTTGVLLVFLIDFFIIDRFSK